ncbi:MAG: PQQ-like beta-propeller repeat protein [Verrucomicrobia bacterium]|nr:PQQ-like beta-propeller repeat protein [Verrucomicrobiota bacterium]
MNALTKDRWLPALPWIAGALGVVAMLAWLTRGPDPSLTARLPGADAPPGAESATLTNAVLAGKLTTGPGQPMEGATAAWPGFRGANLNSSLESPGSIARSWDTAGPRKLWTVPVGDGYAGPAVRAGRVYLVDYDQERREDAVRCLSLADGREIWRFAYPVVVKRNHGMSRTVPAVTDKYVVTIGPKCHVACLDATTGELQWGLDMVRVFGTTVPPWYAGQCPLIEGDRLILAPGGPEALMVALDLATGQLLWQTPNPNDWKMTHSSITPIEFAGQRQYVYCASHGVVGVAADGGQLLWETTDWKITIATVPAPVVVGDGRLFLSGGYNAGALLLQLVEKDGKITAQTIRRYDPQVFGSTQHTPIFHANHIFGIRPDGKFVCLNLESGVVWTSEPGSNFGLGPYLRAADVIFVLSERGSLALVEATPAGFNRLATAEIFKGHEAWGPMALVDGRLLLRDYSRLFCLDVAAK